jgi:hypothetical protein
VDGIYIAYMCEIRNVYKNLVGNPEGKRLPGKPMYTWEDNIKWILEK